MSLKISEKRLKEFCEKALIKAGMSSEHAETMAKGLVCADMWGIYTHGVKNLYGYIKKAEAGGVSFNDSPSVLTETGSAAVIDGNNTMGFISSVMGMNMACDIASKNGIGLVLVKNSCHYGVSGYYANLAAERGMIGIVASNVDKKMTVPGARGMVMGHNPFALAAPAVSFPSVILDISSSNVASLKVIKAKQRGESIPDTWISDENGLPTTDPSGYPDKGALLPMGNHKGYGIAMFIDILTGVILGCPTSVDDEIYSWCFDPEKPNNVCHALIAIDPKLLNDDGGFVNRVEEYINKLQSAPKAVGSDRITVPGERMWERYFKARDEGIELPDDAADELLKASEEFGISLD